MEEEITEKKVTAPPPLSPEEKPKTHQKSARKFIIIGVVGGVFMIAYLVAVVYGSFKLDSTLQQVIQKYIGNSSKSQSK